MSRNDADTPLEHAELNLARRLEGLRDHPLAKALGPVSELADQPPMVGLSAAALLAGLVLGRPRLARLGVQALASVLLATGAKHVIKHTVTRSRPHKLLDEHEYKRGTGGSEQKGEQSFPSGHTADAVAAACAIARVYPRAAAPAAVFAGLAGVAQPIRAAHYPTDVAAGAAIGWAAEQLVERAVRAFATRAAPS